MERLLIAQNRWSPPKLHSIDNDITSFILSGAPLPFKSLAEVNQARVGLCIRLTGRIQRASICLGDYRGPLVDRKVGLGIEKAHTLEPTAIAC